MVPDFAVKDSFSLLAEGASIALSWADGLALLAQDSAPAASPTPSAPSFFSPITLIAGFFFLFYFIVIAPEKRKKSEVAKMMETLKKNDRVVTIGGIHGIIAAVTDDSDVVTLKIDENGSTRVKVNRSAIARIVEPTQPESSKNEKEAGGKT